MSAPHEVVASPLTFFLADVGTDFPAIDDLEGAFDVGWEKLGTNGDKNYDSAGTTVAHSEEVFDFIPAGSTMPVKRFRVGEKFTSALNLVDIGPDAYAKVMNDAAVTTVPPGGGAAGEKHFSLRRGIQVNPFSVLARGVSPVDNDLNMQYEFSRVFVSVNGDVTYNKGVVAMLPVQMEVAYYETTDVILCRMQTTDPS